MDFKAHLQHSCQRIHGTLERLLEQQDLSLSSQLLPAMRYATLNGGKRLRPHLVYCSGQCLGVDNTDYLDSVACALELIHCYSLVHDDLPAMDDDDLRRGRPTTHKAFDEATAILCGDALLTLAFEQLTHITSVAPDIILKAIQILAQCAGVNGMVGGQQLDIEGTANSVVSMDQLVQIHVLKTGALFRASILLGTLPNATPQQYEILERFAKHLGLVFQIRDDILDVTGSTEELGKQQGNDDANNKMTYVSLLGMQQAKQQMHIETECALQALKQLDVDTSMLIQIVEYLIQ